MTRAEAAADELERRIQAGTYGSGDQIPNESVLSAELGVSRPTLREAVGRLVAKGLLHRIHGRGTFVGGRPVSPIDMSLETNLSISDLIRSMGLSPRTSRVSVSSEPAPDDAARALGVAPGTECLVLRRVRTADDEPAVFSIDYLIKVPGLPEHPDDVAYGGSIYRLLAEVYGRPVTSGFARVKAGQADQHMAETLNVSKGALLINLSQVHRLGDGTTVMYSTLSLRNDIFTLVVRRGRDESIRAEGPTDRSHETAVPDSAVLEEVSV